MPKKIKLDLNDLQVQSFVTEIQKDGAIYAGWGEASWAPTDCGGAEICDDSTIWGGRCTGAYCETEFVQCGAD